MAQASLHEQRRALLNHPLRDHLTSVEAWRVFMAHHIFCVWDFMTLLKRLQRDLTGMGPRWLPPPDPQVARFINEVVLAEESDEDGQGSHLSHFELYLQAMDELGVSTAPARRFVAELREGASLDEAFERAQAPAAAQAFVRHTLKVAETGTVGEVAAVFLHGREDLLPDMFSSLLPAVKSLGTRPTKLERYLTRHIELDSQEHGPAAQKIEAALCKSSAEADNRATLAATLALASRAELWDGILSLVKQSQVQL